MLVASMLSLMPLGAPLTRGSLLSDVYQPPPSYTASLTFHIPCVATVKHAAGPTCTGQWP